MFKKMNWLIIILICISLAGCTPQPSDDPEHNSPQNSDNNVPVTPTEKYEQIIPPEFVGQWYSEGYGDANLYTFNEDGTFRDVWVTSGDIMKGTMQINGSYTVNGNTIIFYDCSQTWIPNPDSSTNKEAYENEAEGDYSYEYEFYDANNLHIDYLTYERVE